MYFITHTQTNRTCTVCNSIDTHTHVHSYLHTNIYTCIHLESLHCTDGLRAVTHDMMTKNFEMRWPMASESCGSHV